MSVRAYWGIAYSVEWYLILWMPIYVVGLPFVKQAIGFISPDSSLKLYCHMHKYSEMPSCKLKTLQCDNQ